MTRLSQHNAAKDFWSYALVAVSKTSFFTKTHVKYLEWLLYDYAKKANRSLIQNSSTPTKPHVSESVEADLHDNYETIATLISTLGLQVLQSARDADSNEEDGSPVFQVKGRGMLAKGRYIEEGFLVLAGATCSKELTPSLQKMGPPKIRQTLINDHILEDKDDHYLLTEDWLFTSPSTASDVVLGHGSNGWKHWKLPNGKTLHEVYRVNSEAA